MARERSDEQGDAIDARQTEPRRGLEGKGFDAGTGYGGAGADAAYSGESSSGGRAGVGGDTMRGAYAGEGYGREGDRDPARRPGAPAGTDDAMASIDTPRGTDEHAPDAER